MTDLLGVQKEKHPALIFMKKSTDLASDSWFVYILRCADDSLYTGITKDVNRRCEQHNEGTASRYTRTRLPVVLEYQEVQETRSLALKRELAIKGLAREKKELLIEGVKKGK